MSPFSMENVVAGPYCAFVSRYVVSMARVLLGCILLTHARSTLLYNMLCHTGLNVAYCLSTQTLPSLHDLPRCRNPGCCCCSNHFDEGTAEDVFAAALVIRGVNQGKPAMVKIDWPNTCMNSRIVFGILVMSRSASITRDRGWVMYRKYFLECDE